MKLIVITSVALSLVALQFSPQRVIARQKSLFACFGDPDKSICPCWEMPHDDHQMKWAKETGFRISKMLGGTEWPAGAACTFRIEPDGNIANLFVIKSVDASTDKVALQLVKNSAPFAPPPKELLQQDRVLVVFDAVHHYCTINIDTSEVSPRTREEIFNTIENKSLKTDK